MYFFMYIAMSYLTPEMQVLITLHGRKIITLVIKLGVPFVPQGVSYSTVKNSTLNSVFSITLRSQFLNIGQPKNSYIINIQ
jgi:hypothetical protein